jgi:hypothetical protein
MTTIGAHIKNIKPNQKYICPECEKEEIKDYLDRLPKTVKNDMISMIGPDWKDVVIESGPIPLEDIIAECAAIADMLGISEDEIFNLIHAIESGLYLEDFDEDDDREYLVDYWEIDLEDEDNEDE